MHVWLIALSALAIGAGAADQPALPDQGAAPPSSNPNMGDGSGAGPAGTIGDPNGAGQGAAAQSPGPEPVAVDQPASNGPRLSKSDEIVLKSCLSMPRESMTGVAKCRALIVRYPDLFK
jgi:hypothetical protein